MSRQWHERRLASIIVANGRMANDELGEVIGVPNDEMSRRQTSSLTLTDPVEILRAKI